MIELYKEIPNFPKYKISNLGNIISLRNNIWKTRKQKLHPIDNKYYISLYKNGKEYTFKVHRLVLLTFIGPCPLGMEACHNNGISTDNRLENLRWDTHSNNEKDKVKHLTDNSGERHGLAKLTNKDVTQIKILHNNGLHNKIIAQQYNVHYKTIYKIIRGERWSKHES